MAKFVYNIHYKKYKPIKVSFNTEKKMRLFLNFNIKGGVMMMQIDSKHVYVNSFL